MRRGARGLPALVRFYPVLGIAGSVLISLAVLVSVLLYEGKKSEPYSLLNHFISELGEVGVSGAAWLFNTGLVAAGALFIPCSIGLGLHVRSPLSLLGMAAGVCTGIFLAGVGVFPMNNLPPHAFTAMWFFRLGLLTVLLFGAAFAVQPRGRVRVRKAAVLFSALTVAAYAAFLVMAAQPNAGGASALDAGFARRPRMWPLAVAEWAVFFATILWFLGVSLMVRRADSEATRAGGRRAPPPSRSRQAPFRSPPPSAAPSAPRRSRGSRAPRG
jgi:hypothetical membrane protein